MATEREFAADVCRQLAAQGFRALFAGGCVRDELLGLTPADYDVASDATPRQVQELFRRCILVGASFGVVEVLGPRGDDGDWLKVQVATFRSDGSYSDGRRPDAVTFSSPEEDAARRDFTVNALFADPISGEIIDYVGGREDLAKKVLRAVGDPATRFAEDKLRILRAVRMAARFGFDVDAATLEAGRAMAPLIAAVSAERIGEEIRKVFAHPNRGRGAVLLAEFGLVPVLFPDVERAWDEIAAEVASLPRAATFESAFAIILGEMSSKAVAAACRRFRLSNDEAARIGWLVANRGLPDESLPNSKSYPLLAHPGIRELIDVVRAQGRDATASFCERTLSSGTVFDPPPLLTGDALVAAGYRPGPAFKTALETVRAAQLDARVATPAEALALAISLLPPNQSSITNR